MFAISSFALIPTLLLLLVLALVSPVANAGAVTETMSALSERVNIDEAFGTLALPPSGAEGLDASLAAHIQVIESMSSIDPVMVLLTVLAMLPLFIMLAVLFALAIKQED